MGAEHPDILLSLGTGWEEPVHNHSSFQPRFGKFGKWGFFYRTWDVAASLLENILACQSIWSETVRESTASCRDVREYASRYIRLDVKIPGGVPKLDAFAKVDELESLAIRRGILEAKEVAHRLVASCFYLKLTFAGPAESGLEDMIHVQGKVLLPRRRTPYNVADLIITGMIECRLESERMKGLGHFLGGCLEPGRRAAFFLEKYYDPRLRSEVRPPPELVAIVDASVIGNMCHKGIFSLPPVEITVLRSSSIRLSIRLQEAVYPDGDCYLSISGFPRLLDGDAIIKEMRANRKEPGFNPPANGPTPPPAYADAVRGSD